MTNKEAIEFASKNSFLALYEKGIAEGVEAYFQAICRNNLISTENGLITARLIADEVKSNERQNI